MHSKGQTKAMSTSQPSYQTFVTLINGPRRIWATTPMLWLMSIQAQSPDLFSAAYTTMGKPLFSWMPTSTLLALRLANGRRPKQPTFTPFDLTVPPVVVLNRPSSRGNVSLVLDGNHRIDVLADGDDLRKPLSAVQKFLYEDANAYLIPHSYILGAQFEE